MPVALRRALVVAGGALLLALAFFGGLRLNWFLSDRPGATPALAQNSDERRVLEAVAAMRSANHRQFAVTDSDGQTLRILAESLGARRAVEIGTSTGYSALWLGLAMRHTGGRLTTFEVDPRRAATARGYIAKAGLEDNVDIVVGDAHKNIAELKEPIDLVFIDADKPGYVDYLEKLLPLVREGGLILAHNAEMAPEYMERVRRDPTLETVLLSEDSGFTVTLKKRTPPAAGISAVRPQPGM